MKTIKICTALLMLCLGCKSNKETFAGTPVTGVVTEVTPGCSAANSIPYTITFAHDTVPADRIMVTNLPADFGVGSKIKFSYKENDTTFMSFLTDGLYKFPRRATLISVIKQ